MVSKPSDQAHVWWVSETAGRNASEARSRCENGGQRTRSVEAGRIPRLAFCAAQCFLRLAQDSEIDCRPIAQPAEPPDADPHVRWCDRESRRLPTYVDCQWMPQAARFRSVCAPGSNSAP